MPRSARPGPRRALLTLAGAALIFQGGCGLPGLDALAQAFLIGGVNSIFSEVFGIESSITGFGASSPISSAGAAPSPTSTAGAGFAPGLGLTGSPSILDFSSPALF